MKQCPVCQSTYEDRVDFCFKDGAVLEPMDATADPTALPDPGSAKVPIADAPTQVRKKPRGRGMFARPSVADMLTVSGSHVPPSGGNRVVSDESPTTLGTSSIVAESERPVSPPEPVAAVVVTEEPADEADVGVEEDAPQIKVDLSEAETVIDESELDDDHTAVPDVDPTGLPEAPAAVVAAAPVESTADDSSFDMGSWASSIEVSVSPAAVDVPVTSDSEEDSNLSPPGFDSEEDAPVPKDSSLDDSWFGEDSDLDDPDAVEAMDDTDVFAELPKESDADAEDDFSDLAFSADVPAPAPIEDPGFADVLGSDEVGFDDSSWSAGGGTIRNDGKIPPWMIVGGIAVLAAAVVLTVVLSGDEPDVLPPPPVAQTQPSPPPEVPVAVPEPKVDEPKDNVAEVEEDTLVGAEGVEEDEEIEVPVVEPIPVEPPPPPAVVAPEPPVQPPPPAPSTTPPAPPPEAPAAPAGETNSPPSVWTGAPPPSASTPPTTAASNPWGAPSEPVSRGRLTISTDPSQAVVYIDDRRIGRSPTSTEVDYGTHNVRVEKLDYKTKTRVVNVQSDEVSVPIRLSPTALVGKCNLLGEPGAAVAMNGRRIGSLPLTVECSPGVHRFDVQPAAGGDPFTKSLSVTFVHPGETENLFLTP